MAEAFSGLVKRPGGDVVWAAAPVVVRCKKFFTDGVASYPGFRQELETDENGLFSTSLATPDSGSANYEVVLPDGRGIDFWVAVGDGPITLQQIIAGAGQPEQQDTLLTLLQDYLPLEGGTMTGALVLAGAPAAALEAATKAYVDAAGAVSAFVDLSDTPGSITADQSLFGNAAGNALEFKTASQARGLIGAAAVADLDTVAAAVVAHVGSLVNPHQVTALQVGALAVANNLSDLNNAATARSNLFGVAFGVTGGGTVALVGFNLTVPATGTAALLGAANVFSAVNTFSSSPTAPQNTDSERFGASASCAGNYQVAFGAGAVVSGGGNSPAVAIGAGSVATGVFDFVVGSASGTFRINDVFFGRGRASTNAAATGGVTFNGTGGSGTNNAGASVGIAGGRGTGNAAGGDINFQTAPVGGSGSSLNALVTAGRFDDQPTGGDETRFLLLDLSDGTLKRVVFGADDSAGAGLKALAVAN